MCMKWTRGPNLGLHPTWCHYFYPAYPAYDLDPRPYIPWQCPMPSVSPTVGSPLVLT